MTERTITFDDEQWQIVPRRATKQMIVDIQPRAGEIVKINRKDDRIEFSCDFGLVYRLMLAVAPVFSKIP